MRPTRFLLRVIPALACNLVVAVYGAEIRTTLSVAGAVDATLNARRVDGHADIVTLPVRVPDTTGVSLPEGLWEIWIAGERLWSKPVLLQSAGGAAIRVWRTAALRGRLVGAEQLRASFTSVAEGGPAGDVECTVVQNEWTCWIPQGSYDIRFATKDSAPEYRFGVTVSAESDVVVHPLRFVRGASLAGRVEASPGNDVSIQGAVVSLMPGGGDARVQRHKASIDDRGFFQFKGLAAGDYSLAVSKKGLASRPRQVSIIEEREAVLNEPLMLDKPRRLRVKVTPGLDPAGARWTLRLFAVDPRRRQATDIAEATASETGEWTASRLTAGDYTVDVLRADGQVWASKEVLVDAEHLEVDIAASAVRVHGVVTLGGEPLAATLTFDREGGPTIESDAEGRAVGEIPPGKGENRLILIEAETPSVKRSVRANMQPGQDGDLSFKIALPATALTGRVLNEDGSVSANAVLTVTQDDVFEQVFTGPDGRFRVAGLEPGSYRVTADAFQAVSKAHSVELQQDRTTELVVILEPREQLRGRMTFGEIPVIGAEVYALPRDGWGPTVPRTRTNEVGGFTLELPPGTTVYDGVAVHPAFDLVVGRGVVRADRAARIRTQQIGGTVVVESDVVQDLLLMHNGAEIAVTWLSNLAGGVSSKAQTTVPRLEPGHYSVCRVATSSCASGYLPPFGSLRLKVE